MAFDQASRNRLARFVSEARNLLTEEFTRQLQHEYGLDPANGTVTPLEKLTALDDTRWETASMLRETMAYYLEGKTGSARERKTVLDRTLREQAFTVLNRICALRLAEARGLILQAVGGGYQSQGFQLYARLAGPALGETGEAYRSYLFSLFDEMSVELSPLFDRFSPEGRLFPRQTALLALLDLLNDPELEAFWVEDETIGWIYQYFNSQEERRAMRAASQAPRNSRELAVRNQFFTPRYVVEFLTDNTLGRIWYEMTKGVTALVDTCAYLVRRPTEIFLDEGLEAPEQELSDEEHSQEELLRQPVYIPYRQLKDPREIKMLDPACGSMHFGLYAFDLFEQIYAEAWELEENLPAETMWRLADLEPLHETYPDKADFLRDVPRLIIEYNIHGIDIDPRAVQIAGLSLWLRAHKSWGNAGVRQAERPQIRKSNIVCAEPMPGDRGLLDNFLATLDEARLEALLRETIFLPAGHSLRVTKAMADALVALVRTVWEAMESAGETGSLLKVEETLREAISEARKVSAEKSPLFRVLEYDLGGDSAGEGLDFWNFAERLVLKALQDYANRSANGVGYRRRLFAGDATQGFAFIELCRKRYDAILMNPPFGDFSKNTLQWASTSYPLTKNDIYGAFVERTALLGTQQGSIGAIMPRTWLTLTRFEGLREIYLDNLYLEHLIDLGYSVLESMAEVAIVVMSCSKIYDETIFLGAFASEDKALKVRQLVNEVSSLSSEEILVTRIRQFQDIPKKIFAFGLPPMVLDAISQHKTVEGSGIFSVKQGIATGDNERFLRLLTEIPIGELTRNWIPYAKGGDFGMFQTPLELAVKWDEDGYEIKTRAAAEYGSASRTVKNESSFYLPGLTFSLVSQAGFSVRVFPSGCIYDMGGPCIFLTNKDSNWTILALLSVLNSSFIQHCLNFITDSRHWHVITVQSLPIWEISKTNQELLSSLAKSCIDKLTEWYSMDETDGKFVTPLSIAKNYDLRSISTSLNTLANELMMEISSSLNRIDNLVSSQFLVRPSLVDKLREKRISQMFNRWPENIDEAARILSEKTLSWIFGCTIGRWDIRYSIGETASPDLSDPFAPLPACPPGMLQNEQGLPATPRDVPIKSYPLHISWSGILPDDPGHPEDLITRTRDAFHVIWGDRAEAIETEACEILGVSSLWEYFQRTNLFFDDHLKRYSKSRRYAPIYWPLSTPSGSYTLWLYYHRINDQILYTCITDFVDPKLKQIGEDLARLRGKSGRSRDEESDLERLSDLERELKDFRAELLRVAAFWKPNLNDGVQITAAPLWRLFQHRNWQRRLNSTWEKLEAGEYDWAHLAYSIWPERVREKCKTDKSLSIAHDLEHVYVEPPKKTKKTRRKKSGQAKMDL